MGLPWFVMRPLRRWSDRVICRGQIDGVSITGAGAIVPLVPLLLACRVPSVSVRRSQKHGRCSRGGQRVGLVHVARLWRILPYVCRSTTSLATKFCVGLDRIVLRRNQCPGCRDSNGTGYGRVKHFGASHIRSELTLMVLFYPHAPVCLRIHCM